VAALICLQGAPHYFRRAGKGRYRKAPAEIVAQALAAIEKKKQVQAQIDAWTAELVAGTCPEPVREQLYKILFKPDKNAPEYKAVVEAARSSHLNPLALLEKAGAINSAYQFHWQRFLFDQFPKGTGFPALQAPAITDELPLAPCRRFPSTIRTPPRSTTRSRCRAWAAARSRWASTSRRRAWRFSPRRHRPGGAPPAVHRLHAGPQDHHAARRGGAGLHARWPGATARPCRCT
jgi:hypothetical protein